jgi:hypothetical protein
MEDGKCAIWDTAAKTGFNVAEGIQVFDSPHAGGRYALDGIAGLSLPELSNLERAKLTTWLVDQHRIGVRTPLVTTDVVNDVRSKRELNWGARVERFFLYLNDRQYRPGDTIKVHGSAYDPTEPEDLAGLCAWTECQTDNELIGLIQILARDGTLEFFENERAYRLNAGGFEKLEELTSTHASSDQAFVAMWFDRSMDLAFTKGILPAIEAVGLQAFRIDRKEHINKIDDEIVAELRRSRLVIADFTCGVVEANERKEAIARGGVYFEAGFAFGLGLPVIWSCRSDCIDLVHFDTRQYNHIVWSDPDELKNALVNRIRALGLAEV